MSQLRQHLKMHERETGVVSPKKKSAQIQLSAEETLALVNRDKESSLSVSEQVLIASAAERNRISEVKVRTAVVYERASTHLPQDLWFEQMSYLEIYSLWTNRFDVDL